MNTAPAVSTSDGHGQGLGSGQSSEPVASGCVSACPHGSVGLSRASCVCLIVYSVSLDVQEIAFCGACFNRFSCCLVQVVVTYLHLVSGL